MKLDKNFYENLTADKLEEYAEFVDWKLVPDHMITDEVKDKFYSLRLLRVRVWFKTLLNSIEIKSSEEKFPGRLFFFIGEKCYMEHNIETKDLWCSREKIWAIFYEEYHFHYVDIQSFIKIMMKQQFNDMEVIPESLGPMGMENVEHHFKKLN